MSALDDLKTRIDEAIYQNTQQKITGEVLQDTLEDMVDTMGVSVSQNTLSIGGEDKGELAGQIIDNPEWVRVVTDSNDKVLYGVKTDGQFYFGDGCPPQVQEYVTNYIKEYGLEELIKSHFDYYNVSKHHSYKEYFNVYTVNDGWEKIAYNSSLAEYDELDVYQIGEQCNYGGDAANSYQATSQHRGVAPATITQDFIIRPVYTLSEALEAIPNDIKSSFFAGQVICFTNANNEVEVWELQADDSWSQKTPMLIQNPEFIQITTDSEGKILSGIKTDGSKLENLPMEFKDKVSIDGNIMENIQDAEGRIEIKTDSEGKILSYRDSEGVMHEEVGIETSNLILTEDGAENLKTQLDEVPIKKGWYLPEFGKVNIKSETFYLSADARWSTIDDVVCIQMYDDTDENAAQRKALSYYYIKSTLTPLAGGGYDRTSVDANSVQLQLFGGKDVVESNGQYFVKKITKVDGEYYLTSSLVESNGVYDIYYIYGTPCSMKVNYTDSNPDQTTLTNAIEVGQVTDTPPIKAWAVTKMIEHYCLADIDFGTFYTNTDVAVGIKYQGSGTTGIRKRGFRLTFYKNNTYAKKDKIKIGEMVRLSGFNMKSYGADPTRVKDPVLANIFIEIWETRGKDAFPWNKDNCLYNGATGFIKSFPIELDFGSDFYGLYFFGLKKDEKNYMLDGTDESGIFVSGANDSALKCFDNVSASDCEDEMMDEMSQSTADALDEFFKYTKGFTDGTIEIDGQIVDFTNDMLEERIDINDWIDYWIGLELFELWDNAFHNCIIYSGKDKKKFSLFFYDLDNAMGYAPESSYVNIMQELGWNIGFWEKFIDVYKDYIINRYADLRKSVLSINNITAIYKNYINGIPSSINIEENVKWGASINNFNSILGKIDRRLNHLDSNYFNL